VTQVQSFPPIEAPGARVLILGSMPGRASLLAGQYYAHARNAFWPIMGALTCAAPALDYATRVAHLCAAGIAVWDVLQVCERSGSLDAAIIADSMQANDFAIFLRRHPRLALIAFNGGLAERVFRRLVLPQLDGTLAGVTLQRLPSTSPAHAAMSSAAKLAAWREVLGPQVAR
jgi:double-stranded uracil-DNA glycosylase